MRTDGHDVTLKVMASMDATGTGEDERGAFVRTVPLVRHGSVGWGLVTGAQWVTC